MSDFVHLHLHTEYSLLDGACRIKKLASAVKRSGMDAVAITDHGVMYGVVEFYNEMKKNGVKPIIGCEVYVAPRGRFDRVHAIDAESEHLCLLCENMTGYKNLIRLVSLAFTEGFYGRPRVDTELLQRYHEGLIALSGCLSGAISKKLTAGDYDSAAETARRYRDIFGADNYFVEIQNHGLTEQLRILPSLVKIAGETGIGLVATNDVHYINREDSRVQRVLTCIHTGSSVNEKNPLDFECDEFYLKSPEEMYDIFRGSPEALENTRKIADRCNVEFEFGVHKLPEFKIEGVDDNKEYFRNQCFKGLVRRYGDNPDEAVKKRLEYELSVIEKMGYVDYYLVVNDFVSFARSKEIAVGPGRGSGAGSLAAYCIGITGIDPVKYGLLFERFLNPERVSMPDFDIDFCFVRRQEVIDYVYSKYGADRVSQIITFGTMAARAAIRDVGRVLDIPYSRVDEIAKLIPAELHTTIDSAMEKTEELKRQYDSDPQIKELIDMSRSIEGMPRHASVHASGVVITKEPVWSYVPLAKSDEAVVTQFTMTDIEKLGLLKFDLLGLRTLTVISDTVSKIQGLCIDDIPLDDKAVFELFSRGQTEGVFQFESSGMKSMLCRLRPCCLEDIIAAVSLYRPGPMDYIPAYIRNRKNPAGITYKTPLLKPILDVTYGCLVYQEQVMRVFRDLAGYSYGRSDIVRRAMAKKKHEELKKERSNFIYGFEGDSATPGCDGAVKRGVPEKTASELFDEMMSFADYAYNKAHAASYAVIAYRTAWLKKYHEKEFMAALLTSVLDNIPKTARYIAECSRLGIRIVSPDVNTGSKYFTVCNDGIIYGLLGVKNIGENMIDLIISERKSGGEYKSFFDFCRRVCGREISKRAIESLIKCGALDSLGANRHQMLLSYNEAVELADAEKRGNVDGQLGFFTGESHATYRLPEVAEFGKERLLEMEKETVGIYISGHTLNKYEGLIKRINADSIAEILDTDGGSYKDGAFVKTLCIVSSVKLKSTKNDQTMAYLTAEDMAGSIEVIVFPKTLTQYSHILKEGAVLIISGTVSLREDREPQLICRRVSETDSYAASGSPTIEAAKTTQSPPHSKYAGLHLLLDNEESKMTKRVMAVLSVFEGGMPVYVKYQSSGKRFLLPRNEWVTPEAVMLKELERLLGADCVRILK